MALTSQSSLNRHHLDSLTVASHPLISKKDHQFGGVILDEHNIETNITDQWHRWNTDRGKPKFYLYNLRPRRARGFIY